MAAFNPYTDFNYNQSGFSNSAFNPGSTGYSWSDSAKWNPPADIYKSAPDFSSFWKPGAGLSGSDPLGLEKDKDKDKFSWKDTFKAAGQSLDEWNKARYGQGGGSDLKYGGGGGGISQSGDLTFIQPASPQIVQNQGGGSGSTWGRLAGTVLGIALAPVTGGASLAIGPAAGTAIGGLVG